MSKPRWWLYALLVYVASLPLLLWKSSRLGKTLALLSGGVVALYLISQLATLSLNLYTRFSTMQTLLQLRTQIVAVETSRNNLQHQVEQLSETLRHQSQAILVSIQQHVEDRFTTLTTALTEVEVATADLRQEQRQLVKQRILDIKEQVALLGKSLSSAEIRQQVEEIIPGLILLKDEEKTRFLNDLDSIGFGLTKVKQEFNQTWVEAQRYQGNVDYTDSRFITTGTIVMFEE